MQLDKPHLNEHACVLYPPSSYTIFCGKNFCICDIVFSLPVIKYFVSLWIMSTTPSIKSDACPAAFHRWHRIDRGPYSHQKRWQLPKL